MNNTITLFLIILLFISVCFSNEQKQKEDKSINNIINKGYDKLINNLKLKNNYHNNEELHLNNAIKKQNEKPTGYECIHDKLFEKRNLKIKEKMKSLIEKGVGKDKDTIVTKKPTSNKPSAPIRFHFDTSFITGTRDPYACYKVGDVIVLGGVDAGLDCDSSMDGSIAPCVYKCTEKDIQTTELQNFYKNHVLETIKEIFESRIIVRDPNDNVIFTDILNEGYCDYGVKIPTEFFSKGINNTDIYVWVTSRPIASNNTIAYAGPCNFEIIRNSDDTQYIFGRPTGATINFNPLYFSPFIGAENSISFNEYVRVGIHEMTHALGFSSLFFSNFITPEASNNILIRDGQGAASPIKLSGVTPSGEEWAIKKMAIFSDNVVSFAREHYNCSSIEYQELEELGGDGTAGSHWESRTTNEEYMVGFVSPTMPITDLSLNLLKDSGWYDFEPNVGEPFVWGKGLGCDFVQKTCSKETWNYQGYFCTEDGAKSCTGTRMGKGICRIHKGDNDWLDKYQHLNDPKLIGRNVAADGCPFYQVQDNDVYCFDTSKQSTANSDIFENYCENCRCFEYQPDSNDSSTINQACWEQRCGDNGLQIKISDSWVDCPSGEIVNSNNVTIVCPLGYTICGTSPQTITITDKSITSPPLNFSSSTESDTTTTTTSTDDDFPAAADYNSSNTASSITLPPSFIFSILLLSLFLII